MVKLFDGPIFSLVSAVFFCAILLEQENNKTADKWQTRIKEQERETQQR